MVLHRSHLRWLGLLWVLCLPHILPAKKASPVSSQAPVRDGGNVTCRYRLKGLQTEFTQSNQGETRYSSLPPGSYTFQVTCETPDLGESVAGSDSFVVEPPWWQRWLTEIAGTSGVVLLVWGILWSRYRDRRERERLEKAVAERSAELAQANRELQEASLNDPLTGIRNRRFFQSMIPADASQALRAHRGSEVYSRDHRDLIFFMLDIDHFKAVNDEYGHDAGDRVLVQIAQRLGGVVRESDFLIRWGGEEFLVVFRSTDRSDAELLASRILSAVNRSAFDLGNGRLLPRSCSVGWAAFPWLPPACSDLPVDEVLRLADRGLYLAKQRGRNQAVGLVATTDSPISGTPAGGDGALNRIEKYRNLEQLLEAGIIREVCTPSVVTAAAAR
ncbi:MAG: GGDEF domain-containing protein [Terriglobales bacterium]